ncbi:MULTISPECIES: DNRLRE domain-containing protein [unclassified Streptomyces]|uniref:DNRLRE domain-containing protein n=1 Tax=unclassified Streptomyces TaxID=2593676 RepID=UPI002E820AFA|nr:DNRLRE domain-containing protein [Streptomyces sp. NBC_00589]WTI38992.1 DNRLRE domain-containing protein [Streptomyces sp. NBC_00775]WUB27328.1 DNRLRE domain-containing protein [Streptomyces sp. NBC_00589]
MALLLTGLVAATDPFGGTAVLTQATGASSTAPGNSITATTLEDSGSEGAAKALSFLSEDELARRKAKLSGERVELTSQRTESSTVYANPDGTLTAESYAGPIRVKDDGGTWQAIDTDLSDAGPALEPEAAAADIAVSDGGDKTLASVSDGDDSLTLGWETTLPTPTVDGDTASYDLGDDQTLTVTALKQGISQNVVLDSAPDGTLSYRIPITLDGLTLSQADSGHLLLKNADGDLVAEAPAPMMWDSSKDPASGESQHIASVDTDIETAADGRQTLVLTPDASYFDQDLTYPVTVDPTSTLAVTTDTWVATNYTDSQISSAELKSGTYNGGDTIARSYLKFDVSDFAGTDILDTNLALYSYWSSSCSTSGSGTQVRRITSSWSSSTITWGSEPSSTSTGAVTSTAAKGYSDDCPAGTVNFDIDDIVQAWADGSTNYGLKMKGTSETDSLTWRRWRSANYVSGSDAATEPHLTVTYNSYPKTPSSLTLSPSTTSGSEKIVTSVNPVFSAKVSDADSGAKARVQYAIEPDPDYADTTYTLTKSTAYVSSGKAAALAVPSSSSLTDGTHLRVRARAYDGTDYSTAWTSWQTFTVDTGALDIPDVPSDLQTGATETTTPLLTGLVGAVGQEAVTAEYVLYDSTGAVVGDSPLGTATVGNGERAALVVPETLTDGSTYSWKMRACVGDTCSSYTAKSTFTVDVAAADEGDTGDTVPTAVQHLATRAGETGALVTWEAPESWGVTDEDLSYTVTALKSGATVSTTTTDGTSAVIKGLTNGTAYTFKVTATNSVGTGAAATSGAVTPVAVTGGAAVYEGVVQAYLEAQLGLLTGDYASADSAASDSDQGTGFADVLDAEQSDPLGDRAVLGDEDSDTYEPGVTLSDVLAMPSGTTGTVTLRATSNLTDTVVAGEDTDDPDSTDEAEESTRLYTLTTASTPVLTGYQDAAAAEITVSESADALAVADTSTTDDSTVPDAMETDADGNLVSGTDSTSTTATTVSADATYAADISWGGTAAWARDHWNSKHDYDNDCTNFVSKSLNRGGGMKMKSGGTRWTYDDDDYWWRDDDNSWPKRSYSWANAYHSANFMSRQATYAWHTKKSQVNVGDIIYYNWNLKGDDHPNGFKGISHASVVTKIDSQGNIYITQHSTNRKNYRLSKQRTGSYKNMDVWIVSVFPWYE